VPCVPPAARCSGGTPSGRLVAAAGKSKMTQCTQVFDESGSSQISAKLFVPCGPAVHDSGGETSLPSQV
jgi:hypothetical protein